LFPERVEAEQRFVEEAGTIDFDEAATRARLRWE